MFEIFLSSKMSAGQLRHANRKIINYFGTFRMYLWHICSTCYLSNILDIQRLVKSDYTLKGQSLWANYFLG